MALASQNIVFGVHNLGDLEDSTFGGHTSTAFPLENLAEPDLENPWRTDDAAGDRTLQFNFAADQDWQAIALVLTNFNSSVTVKIEKGDGAGNWTTVENSISAQGGLTRTISGEVRQIFVYIASSVQNSRRVRLTFSGGTALSYYEAYRAFVGPIIQPDHNMQYGWRLRLMPGSTQQRTSQGVRIDTAGRDWRRMDFEFVHTDEAEVFDEWLWQIYAEVGRTGSMLVVPRPNDSTRWAWENLWCSMVEDEGASVSGYNYWQSKFSLEERIG